ncbi:MAG: serine/threonine-protein kinase, partial [Kofleriaceae bacterium]
MATGRENASFPMSLPRNASAIPPVPSRRSSSYFPASIPIDHIARSECAHLSAQNVHPIQTLEYVDTKINRFGDSCYRRRAVDAAERQGSVGRVGPYEIVRRLARGGMADLFLARTVTDTFERLVVIKKILSRYADHPRFVQLFSDEARLAKSLRHKNIVEVFDIGGTGGETFFAMEYLHGQDVRSILHRAWKRDEKMPIKHAVHVATQVASALSYAHAIRRPDGTLLDIVHRDVSPSNILISYDGAVKLLDFGVAKAATSSVKTRTGTLKGKIAYMSPEQAKGGSVDRRSDVFSLGICLWEMLTTSRLFRGENDLATLQLIINEAPKKPSETNPEVPKDLERIVLRALAQDPNQRYQTAHELQAELEEFVRTQQMVQSSGALGMYMSVLFQPEIAAWKDAKAAGAQLSEHLTQVNENKNELTTPLRESEFIEPAHDEDYSDEEEIEDDLEHAAISGSIETNEAWPRRTPPGVPALAAHTSSQPIPIGKAGSTPVVRASAPALGSIMAPTETPAIGT